MTKKKTTREALCKATDLTQIMARITRGYGKPSPKPSPIGRGWPIGRVRVLVCVIPSPGTPGDSSAEALAKAEESLNQNFYTNLTNFLFPTCNTNSRPSVLTKVFSLNNSWLTFTPFCSIIRLASDLLATNPICNKISTKS